MNGASKITLPEAQALEELRDAIRAVREAERVMRAPARSKYDVEKNERHLMRARGRRNRARTDLESLLEED